ncbi:protein kinase [Streptomyces sp. S1D4-11]|nr:protein kinase [Streptomyces sp. S1D4-11]QIZ01264.1 protein kinase [Streptomyces sp. S1D4-11]
MAGRPSSKTNPRAAQASGKYAVPGWLDEGPLSPGRRKDFVRQATEDSTGRKGVIKHVSGNNAKVRGRFAAEARFMYEASGRPGILPAWDIDRRSGDEPRWYAMPRAELLDDALGPQATLLDVVTRITTLAGALAGLAEEGTFHRDIKPDNLFWYDGGPVLADFGIAAFADDRPGLTADHEKLGPANFIAPEMRDRRFEDEDPGRRADVYSLAKTLFVLAQPNLGRFPPDGPHRADAEEFVMELYDGSPGLSSLRHLLEAATQFDARNRLSMAGFRDELQVWSRRNGSDPDRFPARTSPRGVRAGDAFWDAYTAIQRRDAQATQEIMQPSIRRLAEILTGNAANFTLGPADPGSLIEDHLLADHGFPRTHSAGSVPEGGMVVGTTGTYGGRRIVLVAVLDGAVSFVAESHALGPGRNNVWSLEHHWAPTMGRRPRMPSADDDLATMTEQIVQWIRSVQDGTPPPHTPHVQGRRRRSRPLSSSHEKDS